MEGAASAPRSNGGPQIASGAAPAGAPGINVHRKVHSRTGSTSEHMARALGLPRKDPQVLRQLEEYVLTHNGQSPIHR